MVRTSTHNCLHRGAENPDPRPPRENRQPLLPGIKFRSLFVSREGHLGSSSVPVCPRVPDTAHIPPTLNTSLLYTSICLRHIKSLTFTTLVQSHLLQDPTRRQPESAQKKQFRSLFSLRMARQTQRQRVFVSLGVSQVCSTAGLRGGHRNKGAFPVRDVIRVTRDAEGCPRQCGWRRTGARESGGHAGLKMFAEDPPRPGSVSAGDFPSPGGPSRLPGRH